MALPTSGPISSSQIATELVVSNTNFSANSAELLRYTDLNTLSISSSGNILNIDIPNSMSEWYEYNHSFKVSGSTFNTSVNLDAPYTASYPYTTFAQVEMGTTSSILVFTGSNFISSGLAPTASVPYSIYYGPYSSTMSSSRQLLKSGILYSGSSSDKLNYTYIPSSGSIVTFLFRFIPIPTASIGTTAYIKYDQYSSSISSTGIWANIGSGGTTHNLKFFNATSAVSSSGTGTGSYVSFNTGSIKNQYATASGVNIGAKDFSVSTVLRLTKWYDGPYNNGEIFNIFDNNTTSTGFEIYTALASSTSSIFNGEIVFGSVRSGSSNPLEFAFQRYKFPNTFRYWFHLTFTFNSTSSVSNLYLDSLLIDSALSSSLPQNMTSTPLKIYMGMDKNSLFPVGVDMAALLVWTGSILTPGQITSLNNEYKSRYPLLSYY